MDERSVPAGDELLEAQYVGSERLSDAPSEGERCFTCFEGWVWIGRVVMLPDGTEDVIHDPVPCRRCCRKGENYAR